MKPERALRVAIVAPYDLAAAGGINNQVRAQARALRALGHTANVFGASSGTAQPGEQTLGRTVRVTFGGTDSGLGVDPRAWAGIARMSREPFDVVHVHEPMVPIVPWLVILRARAPIVATFHVHREHGHGFYRAWRWALKPLAQRLRARIAVSEPARRTVAEHFPGLYEVIPNGIDTAAYRQPQPRPRTLEGNRRHVLSVGRLEPRKGIDHLIRASAVVRRRIENVQVTIAGEGSERTALEELARELDAPVQFVGRIPDEMLPSFLQGAELVCAPAVGGESFGIVLVEAMAAGTPVVASRIDGYEALAGPSDAAVLVPPGDADALSAAMVSVLESTDRRRALVERGIALARQHDWRSIAPRLVEVYLRAISDR